MLERLMRKGAIALLGGFMGWLRAAYYLDPWLIKIDSYASLITTYAIWWAAQKLVDADPVSADQTASQPMPDPG
ncbi:MAG: hypothetical protein AAF556_03030 [Pseudomonadota bacterium]